MFVTSNKYVAILAPLFILSLTANAKGNDIDLTQYVDLFIGTEGSVAGTSYNGGNVFPGAAYVLYTSKQYKYLTGIRLPFGVVKVGIDTIVY